MYFISQKTFSDLMAKSLCKICGPRGKVACNWDGVLKRWDGQTLKAGRKMNLSLSLSPSWLIHLGLNWHKTRTYNAGILIQRKVDCKKKAVDVENT